MPPRAVSLLALLLALTALGVSPAAAILSPLGTDFALDSSVSCAASEPQVAVLASGHLVAVWRTEQCVWARRFAPQGVPHSAFATQVASGYMRLPRVAPLADGGFAIVWFDLARTQIVVRRADAAGHLGAPSDVLPAGSYVSPNDMAVRAGAGDRLGIAFTTSGRGGAVVFREVGAAGVPTSELFEVISWGTTLGTEIDSLAPVLLAEADGSYRVFWINWVRNFGEPATPQGQVMGRRLQAPYENEPPFDDFIDVPGGGPAIATSLSGAMAADGSYLVAWSTPGNLPASTAGIQAQRMSASGQPLGARTTVESGKPFVGAVTAAASPRGGFAVAWEGPSPPPQTSGQVFLRLLREDASPDGGVETASTGFVVESATTPSVTFLADGELVVAWDAASCNLCDPPPCSSGRLRAQRFAVGCAVAGPGALCLADGRFQATLSYSDPRRGLAGTGIGVPLTADTGYFWFVAPSTLEVLIKVLDGRALNGHYWVFWGGVTDVGFRLTVHDSVTGATRTYDSPAGTFASAADTRALPAAGGVAAALGDDVEVRELAAAGLDQMAFTAPLGAADLVPEMAPAAAEIAADQQSEPGGASPCTPASPPVARRPGLCLAGHRFEVEASWDDVTNQGIAQPLPLSDDTGLFWFFSPSNVELVVKVLDGRPLNGRFWVFYGALTNVAYDLVVRHAEDGTQRRRHSAGGSFGSGADTGALQPPPPCGCPGVFDPVCGRDGRMYGNACEAYCFGWVGVDATSTPPNCAGH
jgi:hypothetical protein